MAIAENLILKKCTTYHVFRNIEVFYNKGKELKTCNNCLKNKQIEYAKQYFKLNGDRIRESNRKYYWNNIDKSHSDFFEHCYSKGCYYLNG